MPPETPAPVDTGYEKARPVATATGPAKPKGEGGEVESIEVRKLANETFLVRCNKKSGGEGPYEPAKESAFPTLETAFEYAMGEFGGGAPAEEAAEAEAPAPPDGRYAQAEGAPAGSSQPYLG